LAIIHHLEIDCRRIRGGASIYGMPIPSNYARKSNVLQGTSMVRKSQYFIIKPVKYFVLTDSIKVFNHLSSFYDPKFIPVFTFNDHVGTPYILPE
jgi:hypothetical protein